MDTTLNLRTTFAIKMKRLRAVRRLSLTELARRAGVSVSYLAEIEAGKKYPKAERVLQLAQALECSFDELASTKLDADLDELQSILASPGMRDFPFEMFGVPVRELTKLLARSPTAITALVRTLSDVAAQYNIRAEHVLHATLRAYQEQTGNYYELLEKAAEDFARSLSRKGGHDWDSQSLRRWVTSHCVEDIDERLLAERPGLGGFRAIRVDEPQRRLFLNPRLTESQKLFALAREVGYHVLGLKARSQATPPDREDSFEQVLNDFNASYFAGAFLLPRARITADLDAFLRLRTWQAEVLLQLLDKYRVGPETLVYRFSQLVAPRFGLRQHFLKFLYTDGRLDLVKQFNLPDLRVLPPIRSSEHYCQRWLSTRLLVDFDAWQRRQPKRRAVPLVGVQQSRFHDRDEAFFCLGFALRQPLRPDTTISLTLGFRADERFFKTMRFAKDRTIPQTLVGGTCERCPLGPDACSDRVAPPAIHEQMLVRDAQERELRSLLMGI
jgi:transcriptional regulator with XRE-family HTH domain